ncbi:MAG: S46 family peptidase, partial [Gemmatimonadota bacterium]
YNLDFSFFRIYDDEGEPLRTENWFQWSDRGAEAGDPIFIIGNPGTTNRLQTVAQLEFRREIGDAHVLRFVRDRAEVLEEFIDAFPAEAEELDLRNLAFSLRNQEKAMQGQIDGLEDPAIIARRMASQREFQDSIQADPELGEEYGDLFERMRDLQDQKEEYAPGFGAFLALGSDDLASPTLHRGLIAFQLLGAQRGGASSSQLQGLMDQMRAVPDRPATLDQMLIEARLRDFIEYYGEDSDLVTGILQGRTVEGAAASIHDRSALSDSASAVQAAERGGLDPQDPAVGFVQGYLRAYGEFVQGWQGITQQEEDIERLIGRARYEVYGTTQPPDATFSLRIADGVVTGYDYNGTTAPAHTTFYGLYDRYYSFRNAYDPPAESPWELPERWLEPPAGFDLATPLDFVSTADIIGGNSGSPVVNAYLQVVGLVFDGNIESLPGDYIYLPELNRSVAVDARGILEALDDMYDMDRLVHELETGQLVETEAEADQLRR